MVSTIACKTKLALYYYSYRYTTFFLALITIVCCTFPCKSNALELKVCKYLLNLIFGDILDSKNDANDDTNDQHASNDARSEYIQRDCNLLSYMDRLTYRDKRYCMMHDYLPIISEPGRKPPIRVRCLPDRGNGSMHIINSLKEVVTLLAPHGKNIISNKQYIKPYHTL